MTDRNQEDLRYMQMALDMAKLGRGYTNPNPMVGAVIVKDGQVIAKGYHHCCGQGHAEVEAFKDAGNQFVAVWLQTTAFNFPMAFFWQLIYAGPIVRFIFRHIFPEKENAKEAATTM